MGRARLAVRVRFIIKPFLCRELFSSVCRDGLTRTERSYTTIFSDCGSAAIFSTIVVFVLCAFVRELREPRIRDARMHFFLRIAVPAKAPGTHRGESWLVLLLGGVGVFRYVSSHPEAPRVTTLFVFAKQ